MEGEKEVVVVFAMAMKNGYADNDCNGNNDNDD